MRYIIAADTALWPTSHKPLPFNDLSDCLGGLVIDFSYNGRFRKYELSMANIPLFLTELEMFLKDISCGGLRQWYLGFAPFAYGLMEKNTLLISSSKGKSFADGICDSMHKDELSSLRININKDLKRYGEVQRDSKINGNPANYH